MSRQPSPSDRSQSLPALNPESFTYSNSSLCQWLRSTWVWSMMPWIGPGLVADLVIKREYRRSRLTKQRSSWLCESVFVTRRRRVRIVTAGVVLVILLFFLVNTCVFSNIQDDLVRNASFSTNETVLVSPRQDGQRKFHKTTGSVTFMYSRLLALAAHALAESDDKPEPPELWREPKDAAVSWTPCANQQSLKISEKSNGYIIVSANGGINQQRVAICNAVAVTRLLNATLVIPNFQYNSVWRDKSQFGDIYKEQHFIDSLKEDIQIVKKLPLDLQSLDLEAVGSLVTDSEVIKEAKPSFFVKRILPILLRNRVVHFVGFGNRLAFDPVPFELQDYEKETIHNIIIGWTVQVWSVTLRT